VVLGSLGLGELYFGFFCTFGSWCLFSDSFPLASLSYFKREGKLPFCICTLLVAVKSRLAMHMYSARCSPVQVVQQAM
jgi:hypothetical protein